MMLPSWRQRQWHPSRAERRVLLALTSGAGNLAAWRLARTAQVRAGVVIRVLDRAESYPWVTAARPRGERVYVLTPAGRAAVLRLLGLTERG